MTAKKKPWEEMRLFNIDDIPTEYQRTVTELEQWWAEHSAQEAAATIPKAVEYGSSSLTSVGEAIHLLAPQTASISPQELAITFYVLGKIARVMAALEKGETPNIDHWTDIGVYGKMVRYIRENGSWV